MKRTMILGLLLILASLASAQTRQFALEGQGSQPTVPSDVRIVMQEQQSLRQNMQYSSDGKYLFTSADRTAMLWEASTGFLIKSIRILPDSACDVSPNGKEIVYVTPEGILSCYNIETDKSLQLFDKRIENSGRKHQVSFSPNGLYCAVVVAPHELHIYDMTAYTLYKKIITQSDIGYTIFTKDSRKLIYELEDKINVYDVVSRRYTASFKVGRGITCIDTSFDGKYIAYALGYKEIVLSDLNGTVVSTLPSSSHTLKFFTDNTIIYAGKPGVVWDYKSKKKVFEFDLFSWNFAISPVTQVCIMEDSLSGKFRAFSMATNEEIPLASNFSHILGIQYYPQTEQYYIESFVKLDEKKSVYYVGLYDKSFNKLATSSALPKSSSVFEKGMYYIDNGDDKKNTHIFFYDFITAQKKEVLTIKKQFKNPSMPFNTRENLCIIRDYANGAVYLYDVTTQKLLKSFSTAKNNGIVVSPNGRFVAENTTGKSTEIFDTVSKKSFTVEGSDITFSADENYCMTYDYKEMGEILVYNTDSGKFIKRFKGMGSTALSLDNKYLATRSSGDASNGIYGNILIYDFATGKLVKNIPYHMGYRRFFTKDATQFVVEKDDMIQSFSVETGELLSCTLADGSNDWLTYIPEGYFNGSEGGINKFVHLVNGMEVSELGQYAETLYRPDLVAAKLRGEDISKSENFSSLTEIVSTGEAPLVQFANNPASSTKRDITVNFSVQDRGGGIGAVYLKLNGKVIQLADGSRKLELVGGTANTTQKSSGKTVQFSHLLTLQNGENSLEAYATNSAGKIESRHAATKISWKGNTAKPNLYVLAVGVNKYRDRSLWLNYAVSDATSIADSFKKVKGNLYQSVNVETIFDADVTASGIASAFNSLAGKVGADDVFIFYISGHGTTHTDGDYYFIPVDFRFRNADSVPESAISKHFITENLSKIKAQKSLVMLDTCNSGAFISSGARGMAEKTALDRLSRATGQATIAASSDTQSAMEGYEGHGIFTYVILEALSGKADSNKDGFISLSELSAYAEEKVPDYSYSKWGYEQYPQIDLRKQSNFPLVGK